MEKVSEKKKVIIVGGGMVGFLNLIYFGKTEQYDTLLFEKNADPRGSEKKINRSINLTLSKRGLKALKEVGLKKKIKEISVPVYSRIMHGMNKRMEEFMYGNEKQFLSSIKRTDFIEMLISKAEQTGYSDIRFDSEFIKVDFEKKKVIIKENNKEKEYNFDLLVGCDGINSKVRTCLEECTNMNVSRKFFNYGYQEIAFPSSIGFAKKFHSIHTWPRKDELLLALPNTDGSFTGTRLMPYQNFKLSEKDLDQRFHDNFCDAFNGGEKLKYEAGKRSKLSTIRCYPYHFEDKCVIMGDAAHAMTPFFGQGLNCGFEDLRIFHELLRTEDLKVVLPKFTEIRKPEADSICKISRDNFYQLWVDNSEEQNIQKSFAKIKKRQKFDEMMNKKYEDKWIPFYTMVAFSHIPYSKCAELKEKQDTIYNSFENFISENRTTH